MSAAPVEYRVVWKREGIKVKRRRYATRSAVDRFLVLFGPEPWKAYVRRGKGPDDYVCCPGTSSYECGCDGVTYRERSERMGAEIPKLEWIRVEQRAIGAWETSA